MTQSEPNDWTLIATQLLREAGEIRARFDVVTDPDERQRLRDRYFQIDRLLDLARQMTEAAEERRRQNPDQAVEAVATPSEPIVQQIFEPNPPEVAQAPVQAAVEEAPAQPFYFERATEFQAEASPEELAPDETADSQEEEAVSLFVEVVETTDEAPGESTEASEEPVEEYLGVEAPRRPAGVPRPQVNVRHVRKIGPKLERQSRNRPLSKRALKARIHLGELTETEAQAILEGGEAEGASAEFEDFEGPEGAVFFEASAEVPRAPEPEVIPELHKEFAAYPPPELPRSPVVSVPVQPGPREERAPEPAIRPVAAAAPQPPVRPVEVVHAEAERVYAPAPPRQPASWELHRAGEAIPVQPLPTTNQFAAEVRNAPDTIPVVPVVVAEVASPEPLSPDTHVVEALPFTPLSQRTKRIVPPTPRVVSAPAGSVVQRFQARDREEITGKPNPRELRRRVLEAGERGRAELGSGSRGDAGPEGSKTTPSSRWSAPQGERAAGGWQARHGGGASETETSREEEARSLQAGSSGIRPKLRPGEKWTLPPVVARRETREYTEEETEELKAPPVEKPRMRAAEPLSVPSVPSAPPADWSGPVVLPVARRGVEAERAPYRPSSNADAEATFASMSAGTDTFDAGVQSAESADAQEQLRAKQYSAALALPATTRDTPNQYKVWLDRAAHEPFVVRRQYFLIRAYLERYGGPFTREVIVLRHLQRAESIDNFLAMKYNAILALAEVAKLVRGGSTSEIEVILLNAEEAPVWENKAHEALRALYMLVKAKRTEYEVLAEKEREIALDAPAPSDHIYYLLRAMMVKRVGALSEQMAIRRIFEHAQDEWLVWESLVAAAYEALLEVDLFNADSLTRVTQVSQS